MALIGWLVLAAMYFLFIPIFHSIWLFVWPLIGVGWLWAALWSWVYFPVFVDLWRAETGRGFAYVPVVRGRGPVLQTAEGDLGSPTRHLGDGWWWID